VRARQPPPPRTWVDDEPGLGGVGRELKRLGRRAWLRGVRTVGLALLVTAAVVGKRAQKERVFTSRVVFRVSEGDIDVGAAPRPARELRAYVLNVAFSTGKLLDLIRRDGLYRRELKRDPQMAVEAMRDDIDVEVWRNYFVDNRSEGGSGRSARIAVEYTAKDRELALEVARALGALIIEDQEETRAAETQAASERAAFAREEARQNLWKRHTEIFTKQLIAGRAPPAERAALLIEIASLTRSIELLEIRLHDAERKKAAIDLRAAVEKQQLGLSFELIDPGRPAQLGISRPRELGQLGVIVFLLVLPLCIIAVGAFDPRVYDLDDIRRLGLLPIGHVARFPGDGVGSLDERRRDGDRVD
jgi:hypothetical protein